MVNFLLKVCDRLMYLVTEVLTRKAKMQNQHLLQWLEVLAYSPESLIMPYVLLSVTDLLFYLKKMPSLKAQWVQRSIYSGETPVILC